MKRTAEHRMTATALAGLLLIFAPSMANNDPVPSEGEFREEGCGPATPVKGFEIEHSGHDYWLPANVRIERDGTVLLEDDEAKVWEPPYSGVRRATFKDYLLIKTYIQDCVDLLDERLFIVGPEGLVLDQPVWTSNWRAGFFVEDGLLKYWSEWFCRRENEEKEDGRSYVYVFSEEDGAFEKTGVPESEYCSDVARHEFIEFKEARAVRAP